MTRLCMTCHSLIDCHHKPRKGLLWHLIAHSWLAWDSFTAWLWLNIEGMPPEALIRLQGISHGLCVDCAKKMYGELEEYKAMNQ